jgi:hypothetical protein
MQSKRTVQYGIILVLIAGLAPGCKAQSNAQSRSSSVNSSQSATQSLKKILSRAGATNLQLNAGASAAGFVYGDIVVNGCSLTFTERFEGDDQAVLGMVASHTITISTYTVPLGKLTSVEYHPRAFHDVSDIVAMKSSGKVIVRKWRNIYSRPYNATENTNGSESVSEFDIVGDDSHQDVTDAFTSAIGACGGKIQGQSSARSSPHSHASLEETLQSIGTGFNQAGFHEEHPASVGGDSWTMVYSDVTAKDCSLTYTLKIFGAEIGFGRTYKEELHTMTVPLGKLSSSRVMPYHFETFNADMSMILLKTSDAAISDTWKKSATPQDKKTTITTGSETVSATKLYASDAAVAQSLSDALAHAKELCGGK